MSLSKEYADIASNGLIAFGSVFLSLGFGLPFTALGVFVQDFPKNDELINRAADYANFLSFSSYIFMIGGGGMMLLGIFVAIMTRISPDKRKRSLRVLVILLFVLAVVILLYQIFFNPLRSEKASGIKTTSGLSSNVTNSGSGQDIATNEPGTSLILNFVVTGLSAGVSLFLAEYGLDKYRERRDTPILVIDKSQPAIIRRFQLNIFDVTLLTHRYRYDIAYDGYRIVVKNNGRNAAQNCKAILKVGGSEEKVSWISPTEGYATTVNAKAIEYIDLCAFLVSDPKAIQASIIDEVNKIPTHVTDILKSEKSQDVRETAILASQGERFFKDVIVIKKEVIEKYSLLANIPEIIAPIEKGYQPSPEENRKLSPGEAEIVVTASNAAPTTKKIRILDRSAGGRLIEFI